MARRMAAIFLLTLCTAALGADPLAVQIQPNIRLHDGKRNKDLSLLCVCPAAGGPYPVIVFSHGAGGMGLTYLLLLKYWASHGYVCLAPTHADALILNRGAFNAVAAGRGPIASAEIQIISQALRRPQDWGARAEDIRFVIDSIGDLPNLVPGLSGKIDAARIGVGGHSYGAYTALLIGGATVNLPDHPNASYTDARAKAILVLSGEGAGVFGLTRASFAAMNLPMMVQTGDRDVGVGGFGPSWKFQSFDLSPPEDKYSVFVTGANHMSFTLLTASADAAAAIENTTLAFWDAYLKSDAGAKTKLQTAQTWGAAKIGYR